MKNNKYAYQSALFIIPFIIAVASAAIMSILLAILSVSILIALVLILPLCRGRENLWMFIAASIISLPFNIKLVSIALGAIGYTFFSNFFVFVAAILALFIVLSIEQILLGIFIRILKPNQLDFDDYEYVNSQ